MRKPHDANREAFIFYVCLRLLRQAVFSCFPARPDFQTKYGQGLQKKKQATIPAVRFQTFYDMYHKVHHCKGSHIYCYYKPSTHLSIILPGVLPCSFALSLRAWRVFSSMVTTICTRSPSGFNRLRPAPCRAPPLFSCFIVL